MVNLGFFFFPNNDIEMEFGEQISTYHILEIGPSVTMRTEVASCTCAANEFIQFCPVHHMYTNTGIKIPGSAHSLL